MIGLLVWLHLLAQMTLYAAEINVVRNKHLYPRSMREPPSDADEVTLHREAMQEERVPEERIDVHFERDQRV